MADEEGADGYVISKAQYVGRMREFTATYLSMVSSFLPLFLQWYDMKLWTVLLGRKVERGCFAVARHELKTYTRLWILVSTLCTTYKRRLLLLRLRVASRYLSIRVCEWKIIKRSFSVWISLSSSLVSCCSRDWISKLCRERIFFFFSRFCFLRCDRNCAALIFPLM